VPETTSEVSRIVPDDQHLQTIRPKVELAERVGFVPETTSEVSRIVPDDQHLQTIRPMVELAERVGFEPTCPLQGKTLSRRPRYDHFGTSPHGRDRLQSQENQLYSRVTIR
jgi:hypothetical protein